MPAHPSHAFKIVFDPSGASPSQAGGPPFRGGTAIVEVEETAEVPALGLFQEPARPSDVEVAQGAALEAVQKDLPHGLEPACLVMALDGLPDEFRRRQPSLYTRDARVWLA